VEYLCCSAKGLRERLVEEFYSYTTAEGAALLAVFSCDSVRYALVLPAGASHPQLLRAEAEEWEAACVVLDFAAEPSTDPEFFLGGLCLDAAGPSCRLYSGQCRGVVRPGEQEVKP
jgi:hypothetical protein